MAPELAVSIFAETANLVNLSCDIIFVDTSSPYFELGVADEIAEVATPVPVRRFSETAPAGRP